MSKLAFATITLLTAASSAIASPLKFPLVGQLGRRVTNNSISLTIASNSTNYNIYSQAVSAGWVARRAVTLTINSGVTVSSTGSGTPSLIVGAFPSGTAVSIVNKGNMYGAGGSGGYAEFTGDIDQDGDYDDDYAPGVTRAQEAMRPATPMAYRSPLITAPGRYSAAAAPTILTTAIKVVEAKGRSGAPAILRARQVRSGRAWGQPGQYGR